MKTRTVGVAVVVLMTVSTLAAVAGAWFQAAAGPSLQATASQLASDAGTGNQPGDNVAVSVFKFVCPFH